MNKQEKENLLNSIKNDPKYLEVVEKRKKRLEEKEKRKFTSQDILTEYIYGETKRLL